ncbi:hypothetical protein ACTOB_003855 [Actinoplanes oblitus]|uniref:Uncharacterized protein n=1 Tax=Actinoplanes oblitus TaxID=3040509 RepID=A0ABY8WSW9_9ACTN|nr:hypothetical protein [Actinoplanes oblitus]WIN01037.1 hypothetical protein ACTOB_003855 [Actinoplanes oblitus]
MRPPIPVENIRLPAADLIQRPAVRRDLCLGEETTGPDQRLRQWIVKLCYGLIISLRSHRTPFPCPAAEIT